MERSLKLKKLYGLKQATFRWDKRFTDFLRKKNFKSLESEQCI